MSNSNKPFIFSVLRKENHNWNFFLSFKDRYLIHTLSDKAFKGNRRESDFAIFACRVNVITFLIRFDEYSANIFVLLRSIFIFCPNKTNIFVNFFIWLKLLLKLLWGTTLVLLICVMYVLYSTLVKSSNKGVFSTRF